MNKRIKKKHKRAELLKDFMGKRKYGIRPRARQKAVYYDLLHYHTYDIHDVIMMVDELLSSASSLGFFERLHHLVRVRYKKDRATWWNVHPVCVSVGRLEFCIWTRYCMKTGKIRFLRITPLQLHGLNGKGKPLNKFLDRSNRYLHTEYLHVFGKPARRILAMQHTDLVYDRLSLEELRPELVFYGWFVRDHIDSVHTYSDAIIGPCGPLRTMQNLYSSYVLKRK